jgi:hypothetical protein
MIRRTRVISSAAEVLTLTIRPLPIEAAANAAWATSSGERSAP